LIFEKRHSNLSIESGLSPRDSEWWERFISQTALSDAGMEVTPTTAMRVSTVFRCWTLLSQTGTLPLKYYERLPDGGKEIAADKPLWTILHDQPNRNDTAVEFWEMMFGSLAMRYNSYAQIVKDNIGNVKEMWPLIADNMKVGRSNNKITYQYTPAGGTPVLIPPDKVLHIRGPMTNGLVGVSPIVMAVNTIGLKMAQEQFSGRLFANQASFKGAWKLPGKLTTNEERESLRKSLAGVFGGTKNAGKTPVLEDGLEWQNISMTGEEAEAIAHSKFSLAEIARFYGVPLHKLNELERATFSNIEEQNTDWVVDTVRPWARRAEAQIKNKLIPLRESNFFAEFLLDALLRGNTEDRWAANRTAIETGVASINEVRARENLNPIEGGDVHLVPLNFIALGTAGQQAVSTEEDLPPESASEGREEERASQAINLRVRTRNSFIQLFKDAFNPIVKREVADLRRGIEKELRDLRSFQAFMDDMYGKLRKFTRDTITPVVIHYAKSMNSIASTELGEDLMFSPELEEEIRTIAGGVAKQYGFMASKEISDLIDRTPPEELADALEVKLAHWEETKADIWARKEVVEMGEASIRQSYIRAGVTSLKWTTVGENCPFCNQLSGRVVGTVGSFIAKGGTLVAAGKTMTLHTTVRHPPAHSGCDCLIRPGL